MSDLNLEHFFPQAKAWVDTLGDIPPGSWVKGPQFGYASWEVGHIISLIMIAYLALPMIKAHEQTVTEQTSNDSE